MTITSTNEREQYINGLRALADLLDGTADLPLPSTRDIEWAVNDYGVTDAELRAAIANIARLLPGRLDKNNPESGSYDATYFELTGNIAGLTVKVWAERARVCRQVVTGTKVVTDEVPACPVCRGELVDIGEGVTVCREGGHSHYRAEVPQTGVREVTREIERREWVCEPLLAAEVAS